MHIGLVVFFLGVLLLNRRKISWISLMPVMLVAMTMEAIDLHDNYNSMGYFRWNDSLHDFVNTCLWPAIIIIIVRFKRKRDDVL